MGGMAREQKRRPAAELAVWGGSLELKRRFRGQSEGGDGVDALGGEGGGSSGGKSNRGSGRISAGWRGQGGGGELALASVSLPPSASGQGAEAWRRCLGGKKRREDGGKGGLYHAGLGKRRWERECSAFGIWMDAGGAAWARAAELAAGSGAERQHDAGANGGGDRAVARRRRGRADGSNDRPMFCWGMHSDILDKWSITTCVPTHSHMIPDIRTFYRQGFTNSSNPPILMGTNIERFHALVEKYFLVTVRNPL
uniref:Uncharacterized protein n=1 Tax=Oryza sativa subsp. japonica TaxID=39947 RepID=Q7XEI0_ORYSJ|nr:hypothetical protein LOC_Os10g28550 [Oryza sativa Japonica Group]